MKSSQVLKNTEVVLVGSGSGCLRRELLSVLPRDCTPYRSQSEMATAQVYFDSFRDFFFNQKPYNQVYIYILHFSVSQKGSKRLLSFLRLVGSVLTLSLGERRWAAVAPWSAHNTPGVLLYPVGFRFSTDQWKLLCRGFKQHPAGMWEAQRLNTMKKNREEERAWSFFNILVLPYERLVFSGFTEQS